MESLPEDLIILILKYIPLSTLLQSVNRVCKRLYKIIIQNPTLWRFFKFDDCLQLNTDQLSYIIDHCSSSLRHFEIPNAILQTADLDRTITFLAQNRNIVTLDLTQSDICTLQFLKRLDKLEILLLEGCSKLPSEEFCNLENTGIRELHVGFCDTLTADELCSAVPGTLTFLESTGIRYIIADLVSILKKCAELVMINISLHEEDATMDEVEEVQNRFCNCTINVF